jgi:hypothetical protein
LRPCIRRDSHPTLTRPRLRHDPHSQQRLRRFLHDPKSLTPAPTQKRNVNIRHVSRENIRRNPPLRTSLAAARRHLDHLSQRRGTIDEVSSHPLGPFSAEEKHDDTAAVDGLKALDPTPG